MLTHYRVLDLTDGRGQLAGEILAVLGADVILLEPPGGSRARRRGPFAGGIDDGEHSLSFWGWNRGKRSVVVDLTTVEGREQLSRMAVGADVLIESGAAKVDLAALRGAYPGLVTVSISAFGSTGPKADWPATDLTVMAAGCQLAMTGDDDRPPVRTAVPQAFLHASADAACGALIALTERTRSGRGQHVDISAQRSVLQATQSAVLAVPLGGIAATRMSGGVKTGGLDVQLRWPCKDGHVSLTFLFGASIGPFTRRFMEWMYEEGCCDAATRDKDWLEYANLLYTGVEPLDEYERLKRVVEQFCLTKTKSELFEEARSRVLLIAPVASPGDVVESEQLRSRHFWDEVDDPVLSDRPVVAPGPFVQASGMDLGHLGRAPRVGEHTDAVLAEPHAPVATTVGGTAKRERALEGLKVLDLTWSMAGPMPARVMADFGAQVIRIESSHRLDVARTVGPFVNDVPGNDSSGLLFNMAAGKRGVSLDLTVPESRSVFEDLIRWADVVLESFSSRGRASLGLDYEVLTAINPSLVMMSSCLFGQTGPLAGYAGFGTSGSALSGFFHLTGWPDRPPCGPFGAYTDYVSPRLSLCALLAALDHRRRTGQGQYLDFAQAEAAVHFLTPAILDVTVNRHDPCRNGNADVDMAPHGVYPSAGDDEWIAVACEDDEQWRTLAEVIGRNDIAGLGLAERRTRVDEIDGAVREWTATRWPADAQAVLIERGVPAHAVQNSGECAVDPQLIHLGHFVELPHSEHGMIVVEGSRMDLSATPADVRGSPPILGEHTVEVLTEVLGYDDERLGGLFGAGALD
ncbi:MAG: CoA transferase [Ilumatobacteraceae bacterium]